MKSEYKKKKTFFTKANTFEYAICKMLAILSSPHVFKYTHFFNIHFIHSAFT